MQFSIEFIPPELPIGHNAFFSELHVAKKQGIQFVSLVNFSELNIELQKSILEQSRIPLCPHVTCHSLDEQKLEKLLTLYNIHNVNQILAIRGDQLPKNSLFQTSDSLISSIDKTKFSVFGGAYPETSLFQDGFQKEIETLERKKQKGATGFITQFFFDADLFLKYRDEAYRRGITLPFIPGILATKDLTKAIEISKFCGVTQPQLKEQKLESHITTLCKKLKQEGVTQFHFFTLNDPRFSYQLIKELQNDQ